jgi:hypothetical protein
VPEPIFSAFLERLYLNLPEHYREADGGEGRDWPLKRYLALLGDQASAVETLLDRVNFFPLDEAGSVGDTSDLVAPAAADIAWLEWMAQLVGVRLDPKMTEQEKRDAVSTASSGWQAGTKAAVAAAARTALTGSQFAEVKDHSTDISEIGAASQWDVLVVTRGSETPDPGAVLTAITTKGAKPAGVKLWHRSYEADWGTIQAAYPTWADWHAAGSWRALGETGL